MELRPYQQAALDAISKEYDQGIRRMLHVMATGTGKTICFGSLPSLMKTRLPGQTLILAHTEDIVKQNADKAQTVNPSLKIGIEMAGSYADATNDDIISTSVQTLGRKGTERVQRFNWNNIDKVILDEAHHGVTDGYSRILDAAGSLRSDTHKLLLGTTATPQRPDGKALSDLFEKVAYVYPIRTAIKDGWLVPIRGYRTRTDVSLDAVSKRPEGDFVQSELATAVNTPERNRQVVDVWLKYGENRKTLVFSVDIKHAVDLAEEFKHRGVSTEAVWGDDPDREQKLKDHQMGKIQVLCNCSLTVEGYDDPSIACILDAAPTMSAVRYTQKVGRGTRLFEGKIDLIVIDVVDGTSKHSLLTLPTLMGMQACLDLQGRGVLDVVEALEALKEEHPSVDFTKLESLDKAAWLIEQVDLFQVRFPAETETASDLVWFKAVDSGYKIRVPKEGSTRAGFVRLFEDAIGKWEIVGRINDEDFHGVRPSFEESIKVADEQIRKRVNPITLQTILREATWRGKPATKGQIKMLTRLFPHKQFLLDQMTAGQASHLISERLARKA
jgi:ATP-dependent helicase IRC3